MSGRSALSACLAVAVLGGTGAAAAGAPVPQGAISEYSAGGVSSPAAIAPGPDGNVWFTGGGGLTAVGRITPAAAVSVFRQDGGLPSPGEGIATGADGNLWVTGSGAMRKVSPDGAITPVTAGLGSPASLVSVAPGPDGNLWFTDFGFGNKAIGRITADGTITEFPLNASAFPQWITAGPDGNVWFTDSASTIARITTGGVLLPPFTAPGAIGAITLGPDGNAWFTQTSPTKAIGRITSDGVVTLFSAGLNQLADLGGLAPGPDGAVWFTQRAAGGSYWVAPTPGAVGRITPDGLITTFAAGLSAGASPRAIAPGPDGRMWFTDNGTTPAIGAVGTGAANAPITAPVATGIPRVGAALVCGGDTWTPWAGRPPLRDRFAFNGYRWLRDGALIPGPPSLTYVVTLGDRGSDLACQVTVTYPLFNVSVTAASAQVHVPAPLPVVLGGAATWRRGGRALLAYTVRNATKTPMRNVVAATTLPAGLVLDATSRAANLRVPAALRYTRSGSRITFRLGTVRAGGRVTLRVNARVSPTARRGDRVDSLTVRARGVAPITFRRTVTIR